MSRGDPFTPGYLVWYGEDGEPDPDSTARLLPRNDTDAANAIRIMFAESGHRLTCGAHSGTWRVYGGGIHAGQAIDFGEHQVLWFGQAFRVVLEQMGDGYARRAVAAGDAAEAAEPDAGKKVSARAKAEAACKAAWDGLAWKGQRDYARKILGHGGFAGLVSQLRAVCSVPDDVFDRRTGLIAAANCVLDIGASFRAGGVVAWPHSPEFMITKLAPVVYDPAAACPWFSYFMASSVPDDCQRWWLSWRSICAMAGLMPAKGWVNLIGPPDSGKSTFLRVIKALGGGYVTAVPPDTFLAKHAGDSGFRQAELRGTRLVHTTEPAPGKRLDESLIKSLTGRDGQRTAAKYEKPIEWEPQCTIFIASNQAIPLNTADEAGMGRIEPCEFARGYSAKIGDLSLKLAGELSGILNYLLATVVQWGQRGQWEVELPLSMLAKREDMADEIENSLRFVREMIEAGELAEAGPDYYPAYHQAVTGAVYAEYRRWCEAEGERFVAGKRTFSQVIGRRYPVVRVRGSRFSGLIPPSEKSRFYLASRQDA